MKTKKSTHPYVNKMMAVQMLISTTPLLQKIAYVYAAE